MIKIENLTEKDIGRWVIYKNKTIQAEHGKIKSWNDKWIFVVYSCDERWDNFANYTGEATSPDDLQFQKSDVCPICEGTGEVPADRSDGEGHMQGGVGTEPCCCKNNFDD